MPGHLILWFAIVVGGGGVVLAVVALLLSRKVHRRDVARPGMYGVLGRMGAGKTYFMSHCALQAQRKGRPVFANYSVEGATRLRSWSEVISVPDGSLVLLDEVHLWWPSEAWKAPVEISAFMSQLRKKGITLLWASQHDAFVSKRLRRLTFGYWKGQPFRRGHRYTLFDGETYDSPSKRQKILELVLVRSPEVMAAYDTAEIVLPCVAWGGNELAGALSGEM